MPLFHAVVPLTSGAAGSIVSTVRIVTKSIGDEHLRTSTLIYFGITLGALLLCVAAHTYAKRHRVISYHYHRLKTDTTVQAVEGVTERAGVCGECHSRVNSAGMHISASDMETENMVGTVQSSSGDEVIVGAHKYIFRSACVVVLVLAAVPFHDLNLRF